MSSPKDGTPIQSANEATSIDGRVGDTSPISAESPPPGWLFAPPLRVWDELLFTFSPKTDKKDWRMPDVLTTLLADRTSKNNIIFATDSYADLGDAYGAKSHITKELMRVDGRSFLLPRVQKDADEQALRTRRKGEVFTPTWVCCLMNNYIDEAWFGRENVFGTLDGQKWLPSDEPIRMPKKKRWQTYVDSRRLEITCGEAPFLVSRYDTSTGELIPIKMRVGILDRKLRIVSENTQTEEEWSKWALRAIQSVYGYEYQGDSLLVARMNVVLSYMEHMKEKWGRNPNEKELKEVAKVVSWNLWQMDGLTGTIPTLRLDRPKEPSLFGEVEQNDGNAEEDIGKCGSCRIFDWRGQNQSVVFNDFKNGRNGSMKFDFIIGNPPYQDEQISENSEGSLKNYAPPIYNFFMDACYRISNTVELIHPARFLFNAGSTPKEWNEKMLNDEHFKVIHYEEDGQKIFPSLSTPLRGGVAITFRDARKKYSPIQAFTKYQEVNDILHKVISHPSFKTLMDIVYSRTSYRLTEAMHQDHPEARYKKGSNGKNIGLLSKGHDYDMSSNIMSLLPSIFHDEKPLDGKEYIQILGRNNNKRLYKWIRREYVKGAPNLEYFKVYMAQANGSGEFGEVLSEPVLEKPNVGSTETFCSIGKFNNYEQAFALEKYIKTKFSRTLLSVLKVTQNCNKPVWKMVPLQNFTSSSDIDWSRSVAEIDRQLYAKYGLTKEEIEFIETHVKEMK